MTKRKRGRSDAISMTQIFESTRYLAVHWRYATGKPGRGMTDAFEIVDKISEIEVFLEGPIADAFDKRIDAWKAKKPSSDQVDRTMSQFTSLARLPLWSH